MFEKLLNKVEMWTDIYSGVRAWKLQRGVSASIYCQGKFTQASVPSMIGFSNLELLELRYLIPICVLSNCRFLSYVQTQIDSCAVLEAITYNTCGLSVTASFIYLLIPFLIEKEFHIYIFLFYIYIFFLYI